jgi:alkylated DNA repair dioxygenase AlkB
MTEPTELFLDSRKEGAGQSIDLPDANMEYFPDFIPEDVRCQIFEMLLNRVAWSQEKIKYFGKLVNIPRLTAWYGDKDISYTYSGLKVEALPWLPILSRIKGKIESLHGDKLNCVLLNLYRNQNDSVAWHSDDEPELGEEPVIASISFGEDRIFQFRHKLDKKLVYKLPLADGSLLIMRGSTQKYWQHQIPKTTRKLGIRINLTYRCISQS